MKPAEEAAAFFGCEGRYHTTRCTTSAGQPRKPSADSFTPGCVRLTTLLEAREREVREECAKVADAHARSYAGPGAGSICAGIREVAAAIRATGGK